MNELYLNNPLLKKAYVPINWTEDLIKKYMKCAESTSYFVENYVKIINLDEGLVPFVPYDYQKNIIDTCQNNRNVIIKTPRQAGKTTTIAAILLWYALFSDNYTIAILANKLSTAREILSRVQRAFENLPKWLQQGVIAWNKTSVELENGSKIIASSTASSAIRGYSINFLYLDEFAFVGRHIQTEFFNSVYPTIASGKTTKTVITSTPNGFELFYNIWSNAEQNKNDYKMIGVNWYDVPGRDEEWKAKMIATIGEHQWRQEFEAEFLGSADTLLNAATLRKLVSFPPIFNMLDDSLHIFEEPKENRIYFCTVDTSRGVGIDYSAFIVFDLTEYPFRIVATYRNATIEPLMYPDIIRDVCTRYNSCPVLVEINDIGQQVVDILWADLEYENIVFTSVKGRLGQVIGGGYGTSTQRGVRTTTPVKRIGCANLRNLIESDQLILKDQRILEELYTFILKNNTFQADEGMHDDLVMCMVLLGWATNQEFFKDLTNTNFRGKMKEARDELIKEDLLPFGIITDGNEHYENQYEPEIRNYSSW